LTGSVAFLASQLPTLSPENAAIDIYNAMGGASWTFRSNWLVGNDICDWTGIICGNTPIGEAVVAM
jgi:hypothetical protein